MVHVVDVEIGVVVLDELLDVGDVLAGIAR